MNINSLTASWESIFRNANTTTADNDLSNNLNIRVKKISSGVEGSHEILPTINIQYPLVFIESVDAVHEFESVGRNARRNIEFSFNIVAITHYGLGTGDEGQGRKNADKESMELAANIETIIRNNINMCSTVDYAWVDNASYSSKFGEKAYNALSKISVKARKIV